MFGLTLHGFRIVGAIILVAIYTIAAIYKWRNR